MKNKKLTSLSTLVLVSFLTGCDSPPSDNDITQAMQNFTKEVNGAAPSGVETIKFNSAKKIGCKDKESDGSYTCTIEYNAKLPFVGDKTSSLEMKFFKINGEWKASAPSR